MADDPTPPARPRRASKITASVDSGRASALARMARYRTLTGGRTVTACELASEAVTRFVDKSAPAELAKLRELEAAVEAAQVRPSGPAPAEGGVA